jgi:hypothetical protein
LERLLAARPGQAKGKEGTMSTVPSVPSSLYDFGVADEWYKSAVRAIEENILVGKSERHPLGEFNCLGTPVASSDGQIWYWTRVLWNAEKTLVGCTCQAGERGTRCKHLAAVLMKQQWLTKPEGVFPLPKYEQSAFEEDTLADLLRSSAPTQPS